MAKRASTTFRRKVRMGTSPPAGRTNLWLDPAVRDLSGWLRTLAA